MRQEIKEVIYIKISVLNGETTYTTSHTYVSKTILKVLMTNNMATMQVNKGFFLGATAQIVPRQPHC